MRYGETFTYMVRLRSKDFDYIVPIYNADSEIRKGMELRVYGHPTWIAPNLIVPVIVENVKDGKVIYRRGWYGGYHWHGSGPHRGYGYHRGCRCPCCW